MADGDARATGTPRVALDITGPGVMNVTAPLGQACSGSVPRFTISSCLDETAATRGQLRQMKGQSAAAATVCDGSEKAHCTGPDHALLDRERLNVSVARTRPKHIHVQIGPKKEPAQSLL
jgi:acetolactate synthase-1/2/3 large subunit/5-guanidino-2-oxopentanoate decarboxylase